MTRNVVLGALCLVLAVPTALQLSSEADSFVDMARVPLMFDGFTTDNVGSILMALPQVGDAPPGSDPAKSQQITYEQTLLQWSDDGWFLGKIPNLPAGDLVGAPASRQRIESDVFAHLRSIRNDPATLVQSNATEEQLRKYGLDDAHAMLIKVGDKNQRSVVAELLVGDDSGIGQLGSEAVRGTFVRQAGSNDVVLYEWQKPWRRDLDPRGWVDTVLLKPEPDKIRRIAIRNVASGNVTFVFEREPGRAMWRAVSGNADLGAVRQSELEGLVQRLRYLAAESFVRPATRAGDMRALGFVPPQLSIAFSVEVDGELQDVQIEVGNRVPGRNSYYMTCELPDDPDSDRVDFLMTWGSSSVVQFDLDCAKRLFDPK